MDLPLRLEHREQRVKPAVGHMRDAAMRLAVAAGQGFESRGLAALRRADEVHFQGVGIQGSSDP